jgi:hypothetical protein
LWFLFAVCGSGSSTQALAVCGSKEDLTFNRQVSQGDYAGMLHRVLEALHVPPDQAVQFYLDPTVGAHTEDVHGQADPDTGQAHIDPGLFLEGESGACQGIAHEWQHLRQFKNDRQRLHAFYLKKPRPEAAQWSGCDRNNFQTTEAVSGEEDAYSCLEDNELATHTAAADIAAILAQVPYATEGQLRYEDTDYLQDNLKNFGEHASMLSDKNNEAYYLPMIKTEDLRIFCQGGRYIHQKGLPSADFDEAFASLCGKRAKSLSQRHTAVSPR